MRVLGGRRVKKTDLTTAQLRKHAAVRYSMRRIHFYVNASTRVGLFISFVSIFQLFLKLCAFSLSSLLEKASARTKAQQPHNSRASLHSTHHTTVSYSASLSLSLSFSRLSHCYASTSYTTTTSRTGALHIGHCIPADRSERAHTEHAHACPQAYNTQLIAVSQHTTQLPLLLIRGECPTTVELCCCCSVFNIAAATSCRTARCTSSCTSKDACTMFFNT
mmetsp:Transcript_1889/g.4148  ORF Transcript_1889/g.4148 Transcript_1889/m.4148 type:complete len:220 (-) Transcript_1889:1493-2152(-)